MKTKNRTMLVMSFFFFAELLFVGPFCFGNGYDISGVYDVYGTNPDGTIYSGTVEIAESGDGYELTWGVGGSYTGNGWLDGDSLTVDFGEEHPVIYTVIRGGRVLVGTWAEGKATEVLCIQGDASSRLEVGGDYQLQGTNPDGSLYSGTVTVIRDGSDYSFTWEVGGSVSGSGTLYGNTLTLDWGEEAPVIYEVREGGSLLIGVWAEGSATEIAWQDD